MKKENKIFTILLISLLLITIISIISYQLTGAPEDDTNSVNSVKAITYNIHLTYDFGTQGQYNLVKVKELIEDSNADIIGLQESEGNRLVSANQNAVMWLSHQLGMYYYYGAPTSEGIWGVSLISRWNIDSVKAVNLPSEGTLQRIALVAVIDVPEPFGSVNVIVTHLEFKDHDIQKKQVKKIIEITSSMDRVIILGDFNTVIAQFSEGKTLTEDPTYQLMNDSFIDAWVVSGGSFTEPTSFAFVESEKYDLDNYRIDYIWLKGLKPVIGSHKILGDKSISDHRAILIEITTA